MGYSASDNILHKVISDLRKKKHSIMSEYKLLEAQICLNDLLIHFIDSDFDADLYKQFQDGFLTLTQFVSQVGENEMEDSRMTDAQRYYLLTAFVNLEEAQAAHEILQTRKPRKLKEVK